MPQLFSGRRHVEGTPATYTAEVVMKASLQLPKWERDRFRIELSDGYLAIGNPIVGGNIQLISLANSASSTKRKSLTKIQPDR